MPQFLESLKVLDGEVWHLAFHQKRVNQTAASFHFSKNILLEELTARISFPAKGLFKWRIVYDEKGLISQELQPYVAKIISKFTLVAAEGLEYAFKFADRSCFAPYIAKDVTEPLFTKNGLLTDSSYANLIFCKEGEWFTPRLPLLKGTQRAFLLEQNLISEADISAKNLTDFQGFKLINAMMGLESQEYPISTIAGF